MPKPPGRKGKRASASSKTQKASRTFRSIKSAALHALQLAEDRPDISLREVSRIVAVQRGFKAESVLRAMSRHKREEAASAHRHGGFRLSDGQEKAVIGTILGFDQSSNPLKGKQIHQAIRSVFQVEVSKSWLTAFKQQHHKYIRTLSTKAIQTCRLKATTPSDVEDWLGRLRLFMEHHHFPAHARFNFDETRVIPQADERRVIGSPETKHLNKNNRRSPRKKSLGTCAPFVSADGAHFMAAYIIKDQNETHFRQVIPEDPQGRCKTLRLFAISKSGFLNKGLFRELLLRFEKVWHLQNPGLDCIVFLDNCSPHRSDEVRPEDIDASLALTLARRGVWLYFLPPNTTAWLQPLDDVAFGLFKLQLGRKHDELAFESAALRNQDGTLNLQHVIEAESHAFTSRAIKKSWINTGLAQANDPTRVDEDKIMARARETFGQPKRGAPSDIASARRLATNVIRSHQPSSKKEPVRVAVDKACWYSADELSTLDAHQRAERAEVEARKQRETQIREEAAAKRREAQGERRETRRSQAVEKEKRKQEREARQEQSAKRRLDRDRVNRCRRCQKTWRGGRAGENASSVENSQFALIARKTRCSWRGTKNIA